MSFKDNPFVKNNNIKSTPPRKNPSTNSPPVKKPSSPNAQKTNVPSKKETKNEIVSESQDFKKNPFLKKDQNSSPPVNNDKEKEKKKKEKEKKEKEKEKEKKEKEKEKEKEKKEKEKEKEKKEKEKEKEKKEKEKEREKKEKEKEKEKDEKKEKKDKKEKKENKITSFFRKSQLAGGNNEKEDPRRMSHDSPISRSNPTSSPRTSPSQLKNSDAPVESPRTSFFKKFKTSEKKDDSSNDTSPKTPKKGSTELPRSSIRKETITPINDNARHSIRKDASSPVETKKDSGDLGRKSTRKEPLDSSPKDRKESDPSNQSSRKESSSMIEGEEKSEKKGAEGVFISISKVFRTLMKLDDDEKEKTSFVRKNRMTMAFNPNDLKNLNITTVFGVALENVMYGNSVPIFLEKIFNTLKKANFFDDEFSPLYKTSLDEKDKYSDFLFDNVCNDIDGGNYNYIESSPNINLLFNVVLKVKSFFYLILFFFLYLFFFVFLIFLFLHFLF